jgi:hypothetical protein
MTTKDNQEAEREAFEKLIIPVLNNLPISETKYQYALNSIKTAFDMMTTITTPQVNVLASGEVVDLEKECLDRGITEYDPRTECLIFKASSVKDVLNQIKQLYTTPSPSNVLVEALEELAEQTPWGGDVHQCQNWMMGIAQKALATYSASTDSVSKDEK